MAVPQKRVPRSMAAQRPAPTPTWRQQLVDPLVQSTANAVGGIANAAQGVARDASIASQAMASNPNFRPQSYYDGLSQQSNAQRQSQQAEAQARFDNLVGSYGPARLQAAQRTGNYVSSAMAPRMPLPADALASAAMTGQNIAGLPQADPRLNLQPNRFGSAPYTGPRSVAEQDAMLNNRDAVRAQRMGAVADQAIAMRQAEALGMQDALRERNPMYNPGNMLPSGNTMTFATNDNGIGLVGRESVRAPEMPNGIAGSTFAERRALVNRLAGEQAGKINEMTQGAREAAAQRENRSIVSRAALRGLDPRTTPMVASAMEALGMRVPGSPQRANMPGGNAQGGNKPQIVRSADVPNDINQIQQAEVSLYASPQFQALNIPNPHTMTDDQLETAIVTSLNDQGIGPNLPEQTSETLQEALRLRARRTGKKLPPRLQIIADGGVDGYRQVERANAMKNEQNAQMVDDSMSFNLGGFGY